MRSCLGHADAAFPAKGIARVLFGSSLDARSDARGHCWYCMLVRQNNTASLGCRAAIALFGAALLVTASVPAAAQRIENGVAVFAALDKVTARISKLEVKLGETAKFGALKIVARACYSRSPTEPPKTTSFVEVQETLLDGKEQRIFSGWMFAESPGLNALEHPVFDLWLTECSTPVRASSQKGAPPAAAAAPPPGTPPAKGRQQPAAGAVPAPSQPWSANAPDDEPLAPRRRPPR